MVRFKNRYLLIGAEWKSGGPGAPQPDAGEYAKLLRAQLEANFGEAGAAAAAQSLKVVWHGPGVGLSILRCSTADTDRLRLTLATLTSIAGRQLAHNTLFVSGRLANVKRAAVAAASRSPICASQASLAAAVQEIQNVTA